eukprot:GHRR01003177.1.p1 GENE.GHRR01003177.1~~GHRR01003177.1.p1  ORF type:complete len:368 (+),score=84.80 GHRR01003177.1:176-1279(+)
MDRILLRALLQHSHEPAEDPHAGETAEQDAQHSHGAHGHDEAAALDGASTLDLRIIAIFVILAGAVLFGLPTLVFKQFKSPDAIIPRLLRAFAGGVIVALALVHIIPEAVYQLDSLLEFHVGGCAVLFGIVALVLVDNCLAALLAPESYKQHIREKQVDKPHGEANKHDHGHGTRDVELQNVSHSHQCMRTLSPNGWVASAAAPTKSVRQYVTAYTMELGCIFHSIIIGVGVGVLTSGRQLVIRLMVALAIHQGLEALALGSVLAVTGFHTIKKIIMLLMYSITTPIGIAIGIAISASYDSESVTSRAVQGTFNGVSGGMLLYIGMYQLIAEEFSREDILVRPRLRVGMHAALLLGAAVMCILGIWA